MRVGVVGTESSHVDLFLRHVNVERRFGDARITALWGADPARTERLAKQGSDVGVVPTPEAMLGEVDAAIVADRDGADHRVHAMPFLEAGLPVLVDKPFATSVEDAVAMTEAANAHQAPLLSASALRWSQEVVELAGLEVEQVSASGPADPSSPYSGWHFYGVHPVEMALALVDGELGEVAVDRRPDRVVLTTSAGATPVEVALVAGKVPFSVSVVTSGGVRSRDVALVDDYLAPVLGRFVAMARTGERPLSDGELVRSVRLLAAVNHA